MSSMKRSTLRESVITSDVNWEGVVNGPCLVKEVDLVTCKKQEVTFCSPFIKMLLRRNTYSF